MTETLEQEQLFRMIRRATDDVFTAMLGVEVKAETPYVQQTAPDPIDGIVSFIGLAGAWVGTGGLSCSARCACRLSSSFLMTECHSVDDQVLDAMGELTNMIIGNVKNDLEEQVGPMGLSIPTVIHGRNFSARSLGRDAWNVVPFRTGEDRLDVKICLSPRGQSSNDSGARSRGLLVP